MGRYKTESSHRFQNRAAARFSFTIHNICYQTLVYPANLEITTAICPLNRLPLEPRTLHLEPLSFLGLARLLWPCGRFIEVRRRAERWPSGLRRTLGKRVYRKVSRVRIPVSPPPSHYSRHCTPPSPSATATDSHGRFELAADYSRKDALRVNATFSVFIARETNLNVEEITLPQSGAGQYTTAYEFRTAFSAIGRRYIDRGGISA